MSTFDFSRFFHLSDPFSGQAIRLKFVDKPVWLDRQAARCLATGEIPSEMQEPLQLQAYEGRKITDFLWASYAPLRCISDRTVRLLKENGFTGWSTYPVSVSDQRGNLISGYYGLAIVGRAGVFQRDLSAIVTVDHPWGGSTQVYKGFYFEPERWDKSDLFWVGGKIIVTSQVQQAFRKAGVSNVEFTRLDEVEVPVSLYKE